MDSTGALLANTFPIRGWWSLYEAFLAADGFARRAAAAVAWIEKRRFATIAGGLRGVCGRDQIITTVDLRQVFLISRRAVAGYRRLCWMLALFSLKVGLPDIVCGRDADGVYCRDSMRLWHQVSGAHGSAAAGTFNGRIALMGKKLAAVLGYV
jgi:hypothetical protein